MSTFKGFSQVKLKRPEQSTFDLSHDKRMDGRMGVLYPILITETIPSDSFKGSSEVLMRLAPLIAPIYDNISVWVHYFYVPNRLLWEEWETFITGGRLGPGVEPAVAPVPPQINIGGLLGSGLVGAFNDDELPAYLGVPNFLDIDPTVANWNSKFIDAMPFAAYQLVYEEYYRDRNFVDDSRESDFPLASGAQSNAMANKLVERRRRNYMHDYFTSALPFTQRGEEVLMPIALGGIAPLYANPLGSTTTQMVIKGLQTLPSTLDTTVGVLIDDTLSTDSSLYIKGEDFDGTSTSINDFRSAYALQVWMERNAIAGSRYTESTQAHFGITPEDSRLQRPEYIGGGRINVQISEVVSTAWASAESPDVIPQGNMAGHGVSYGNSNRFNYFCTEHGFIIGLLSIMAKPSYQQGLPRMFRRSSFLDYPWPTFAKLGEQPVRNYELYTTPASLTPDADGETPVFGYQSRYADWKWIQSTNAGGFRDSLLFWTLTRTFTTPPVLGATFVAFQDDTQYRIFAADNTNNFWMYIHNALTVRRALPYFGTPNTLGFQ